MPWHRMRWAGPLLRLSGACALMIGVAAGLRLFSAPSRTPGPAAYLLALIVFASASAGSTLLMMGAHLFDSVSLSPRWTRRL